MKCQKCKRKIEKGVYCPFTKGYNLCEICHHLFHRELEKIYPVVSAIPEEEVKRVLLKFLNIIEESKAFIFR